ncbi:MAG: 1-acyl-sn-glycerol-3-phosphate acyltransferase [Chloroflexi bacterium]|nr:1-acyl-sn-glycerol-3-phosphate acyltransferase [Chloroflexota bacterium]
MTQPQRQPLIVILGRYLARFLLRVLTRLDAQGLENFPETGPAILTPNHVVWSDVVFIFAYVKSPVVTFAAEKWETRPILGWLFRTFGNAIFVHRGEIDRKAILAAIRALKNGAVLGVAPEGTRSYDGILRKGHDGAAWLAARTDATIVPIAIWGHENMERDWLRLHRPVVHMRVGEPYKLPPEARQARAHDMDIYTDMIMRKIAELLPPERRGEYG